MYKVQHLTDTINARSVRIVINARRRQINGKPLIARKRECTIATWYAAGKEHIVMIDCCVTHAVTKLQARHSSMPSPKEKCETTSVHHRCEETMSCQGKMCTVKGVGPNVPH